VNTSVALAEESIFRDVVGQEEAVQFLRAAATAPVHAYLLVGPRGSGKKALARAFAAAILSAPLASDAKERAIDLVLQGKHPDVMEFEREGAFIRADDARAIIDRMSKSAMEGGRKVAILDEFHLVRDAAPMMLKTIEEPSAQSFFIVLADEVTESLVTIASRCVRVNVGAISSDIIEQRLIEEGVAASLAHEAASAAEGDLSRARLLVRDPRLSVRRAAWRAVPDQLEGRLGAAVELADNLLATIDDAMAPLLETQKEEIEQFDAESSVVGKRATGRKEIIDRHKREVRRYRTDELRFGLTELARRYREEMIDGPDPKTAIAAIEAISSVLATFTRNPNDRMQLVALFARLGRREH